MNFDESVKKAYESKNYAEVIKIIETNLKETKEKLSEETLQCYLKSLSYFGIYDRALKYLRRKSPKNYKTTKDSFNNVRVIREELSNDNVSESILFDYYVALIKSREFEKAYTILNSIKSLYPEYIDDFLLVIMLLRCNKYTEAKQIIDDAKFNGNQLIKIGLTLFTIGQYRLSKKTLEEARIEGFSKQYDELYEKIRNTIIEHYKTGKYVSMNYEYFQQHYDLAEGDIIYVSEVNEEYKNIDPYALKRTYMVWKIDKEKVYAFPITNKIPKEIRCYKLFKQNYLNFDSDRAVKSHLVTTDKKYIQKVQERLTKEDYNNVLSNIYSGLIVLGDENKKESMKMFIDDMYNNLNVEKNNIIVAYDREEKKAKNYLVIEMDDENLYCVEVLINAKYAYPIDNNLIKINRKNELLRINKNVKISDKNLEETNKETRNIIKKK